jgi:hypothetical protein
VIILYKNNFWEWDWKSLPADGKYYFNVLLFVIPFFKDCGIEQYWDLEQISEPRPQVTLFYHEEKETEAKARIINKAVIEVRPNEISWYKGE